MTAVQWISGPRSRNGVELKVGDEVIIRCDVAELVRLERDEERTHYEGERFMVKDLHYESGFGGSWFATADREVGPGYDTWPVGCLVVEAQGLRGLVQRYKELKL